MKRDRCSVEKRRTEILKLVREKEEVRVEELAQQFGLSLMTVRRDLQVLEDKHLVKRFYGGATIHFLPPAMTLEEEVCVYCDLISRFAATLVEDGDTLFINGSRTALNLLDYVTHRNVTAITNNGWAVGHTFPPGISITITGGLLRGHTMIGEYVMKNLLECTADKAFLGCAGVYDNGEFLYNIPTEIGINEVMITHTCKQLYIVADHTKLFHTTTHGTTAHDNVYGSCSYEQPVTLITDEKANPLIVQRLQEHHISVHQVSREKTLI